MEMDERHSYAAAAAAGMSILGEGALILRSDTVTVFTLTLLGGLSGIYIYSYFGGEAQ